MGQECTLQPKTAVRLSPVWQVALIWLAVKVVVEELLRAVSIPVLLEGSDGKAIISTGFVGMGLIGALIATLMARLWHPRAALRGILCGLGIQVCFGLVFFVLYFHSNLPPQYSRDAIVRSNLITLLGVVLTTLGTLLFAPKITRKFRRSSL